jgi:hypothetical protein
MTGTTSTTRPAGAITAKCNAKVNSGSVSPLGSELRHYTPMFQCHMPGYATNRALTSGSRNEQQRLPISDNGIAAFIPRELPIFIGPKALGRREWVVFVKP